MLESLRARARTASETTAVRWAFLLSLAGFLYWLVIYLTLIPLNRACGAEGEIMSAAGEREVALARFCAGEFPGARAVELTVGAGVYLPVILILAAIAAYLVKRERTSRILVSVSCLLAAAAPLVSWSSFLLLT